METATIRTSQHTHTDFFGKMYFELFGATDVKFSPKVVIVNGAKVVLLHVEGVNTRNASKIDFDMWPRYNCTEEFIKNLPQQFGDIMFRIGYWPTTDVATGEKMMKAGEPRFLSYFVGGKEVKFDGNKHEYGEDWNNDAREVEEVEEEAAEEKTEE